MGAAGMTFKLDLDDRRSSPILELTQCGKDRPMTLFAATRLNLLFVPYQGVIR
jgi:UDP-N-acetyl-D-mannosaminuronate dehydrogenase